MSAQPGSPIRSSKVARGSSPEQAARAFLTDYGSAFGLRNPGQDLTAVRTDQTPDGVRVVRFQQKVSGVPVLAGEIVVASQADGAVLSVSSDASTVSGTPTTNRVDKASAISVAFASVAKETGADAAKLRGNGGIWLYEPTLVGDARPGTRNVWRIEVTSTVDADLRYEVLVDANTSRVVLALELNRGAKQRVVCDFANQQFPAGQDPACNTGNPGRIEGGPVSTVADVNQAYDNLGHSYDYYSTVLGRDSFDGIGSPLRASVRVCRAGSTCPFKNAYWNGEQLVFGQGYAGALDVVGHELTHGVNQYTAGFYYAFQSGALDESFADIFGQLIQFKATGMVPNSTNWTAGENLPGGAIRNMANPGQYGQPDKMTASNYWGWWDPNEDGYPEDNGGVHYNSGVGNNAAYLIAQPGSKSFGGTAVNGIGLEKAGKLYYRALQLLVSGSDYADLADALENACQQLVSAGDLSTTECGEVSKAIAAVEMRSQPIWPSATAPESPQCPTGSTRDDIQSTDFEGTTAGNSMWTPNQTANWGLLTPAQYGLSYAHSGVNSWLGGTPSGHTQDPSVRTSTTTMTNPIAVPAGRSTFFWFAHALEFDSLRGVNYDGGRVEYQVDNGAWTDAGSLFTHNGYNVTVASGLPISGRAFGWSSHGYMSSRLELTQFAGRQIKLRFALYADDTVSSAWIVDDTSVYSCTSTTPGGVRSLVSLGDIRAAHLTWQAPEATPTTGVTGYQITATPALAGFPKTVPANTTDLWIYGLAQNTHYRFGVTPTSASGSGPTYSVGALATWIKLNGVASPVRYPTQVNVNGTVYAVGGTLATSGYVQIHGRATGTTTWSYLGTVGVASNGTFSFWHRPPQNYQYTVVHYGGRNFLGSTSSTVGTSVIPQVSIAPSTWTPYRGTYVTFSGTTLPVRRYATISLQYQYKGRWYTLTTGKTYYAGSYKIAGKLGTPGSYPFRVVVHADGSFAEAISVSKTVTFR